MFVVLYRENMLTLNTICNGLKGKALLLSDDLLYKSMKEYSNSVTFGFFENKHDNINW